MTSETLAIESAPNFPTHSPRAVLLFGLCLLALCTALLGGFLAHVWRAPQPDEDVTALSGRSADDRTFDIRSGRVFAAGAPDAQEGRARSPGPSSP